MAITEPASLIGSAKTEGMPHRTPRIFGVGIRFPCSRGNLGLPPVRAKMGIHEVALREICGNVRTGAPLSREMPNRRPVHATPHLHGLKIPVELHPLGGIAGAPSGQLSGLDLPTPFRVIGV
jgi:hypothetical protein